MSCIWEGPVGNSALGAHTRAFPLADLDRSQRLQPFEFQPLNKRQLDAKAWQKIRGINVDKLVSRNAETEKMVCSVFLHVGQSDS